MLCAKTTENQSRKSYPGSSSTKKRDMKSRYKGMGRGAVVNSGTGGGPAVHGGACGGPAVGSLMYDGWRSEVLRSLPEFLNKTDSADVCVLVGEDKLYVHKLVLQLNSSIVESQHEIHFWEEKLIVDLLDFSPHKDIVVEILNAFYTGSININNENIKVVYKFSKCYSVTWLTQHTLGLFDKRIKDDFIDVIQFSHTIACDKLKAACLEKLTKSLAEGLVASGQWFNIDYQSLRSIVNTDKVNLSELEIFELVAKWFEHDVGSRKAYIGELLDKLRYQLIPKEDLMDRVYDWISNIQDIDDKTRLTLLINIHKHSNIKVPGILKVPSNSATGRPSQRGAPAQSHDTTLSMIIDSVKNNNCAKCTIDPEQLVGILRENFARADPITKQCVIEYISDNRLVDDSNITELLKLYNITKHQNIALLCVQYINKDITTNIHHVAWEDLSCGTLRDVIPQIHCGKLEYLLVECIMRWVDEHPTETDNIKMLLATVCYSNIPQQYLDLVLAPFVSRILMFEDHKKLFRCTTHQTHNQTFHPFVATRRVPQELYLLAPFEVYIKHYTLRLDKFFDRAPLKLIRTGKRGKSSGADKGNFVLFDKDMSLDRYPVSASLTLPDLRQIVEKHHNLHFMFIL